MIRNLQFFNKTFFLKRIPFFWILLLILISVTLFIPVGFALNIPSIPILCIVFWSLQLGKLFSKSEVFLLGIFTDILMGTALGFYALLYLIISVFSNYLKYKFLNRNIYYHFIISFLIILLVDCISNFFLAYFTQILPSFEFLLFNYLLTISLYPGFFVINKWFYNILKLRKYYVEN